MSRTTNAELRELLAKATPGPWRECGHDRGGCCCGMIWSLAVDCCVYASVGARDEGYTCGEGVSDEQVKYNATFLVAAVNSLAELVRENEEMREALGKIQVMAEEDLKEGNDGCRLPQIWTEARAPVEKK